MDCDCHRIRDELVGALARVPMVRRIVSFGSIAEERCDQWSDVDLLAICDDVEASQWMASSAIRSAKSVRYYRMFSDMAQPSGRYWFDNHSPFHRLDITFCSMQRFDEICRDGVRSGYPIKTHEEHSEPSHGNQGCQHFPVVQEVKILPFEVDAGRALYLHLEAVKNRMRGRTGKRDPRETRCELEGVLRRCHQQIFAGGNFVALARESLDLDRRQPWI